MTTQILQHAIVSAEEQGKWPVDRAASGEKRWAEIAWTTGPLEGDGRFLFNWNTWPCRVVFKVDSAGTVARGEAVWRRSRLSIRMRGLKLLCAATGEQIPDAHVIHFDQERVIVDFQPIAGPGLYYLYYGALEEPLFKPSPDWTVTRQNERIPVTAVPLRIEARNTNDDFDAMEQIALADEMADLRRRHSGAPYLVFPEDRNRPIKLQFELPAHWALEGPRAEITLNADRHEYRVFQLGLWAAQAAIPDVRVEVSDLCSSTGTKITARLIQCLTIESRIKSRYIAQPHGPFPVPRGQVRALWFGIDIPADLPAGDYSGGVRVLPEGLPPTSVALRLIVSNRLVEERGDHDHHRLSRLRWIESDVGLSNKVYPPYKPLRLTRDKKRISTWGHTIGLGDFGLPDTIQAGSTPILARPIACTGQIGKRAIVWRECGRRIIHAEPGLIEWRGQATAGKLRAEVEGRIEYDGCVVLTLTLAAADKAGVTIDELALEIAWLKAQAGLATGLGYRGRRDGNRNWRHIERSALGFSPDIWMGSVEAGLGWITWLNPANSEKETPGLVGGKAPAINKVCPWEDVRRPDAATVTEEADGVVLRLNLGRHTLKSGEPWRFTFALRPTPIKPADPRHWQFRYMHKGGGFWPTDTDTPQSFLKDNCRRLDHVVNELGVKRLNLHDWWGPAFNYAWQWDGPDNLARLTSEAHKRGIFVKVYNSGREMSCFAPEFWAMVHEASGTQRCSDVPAEPKHLFQDAWHPNHLPDNLPGGWPRLHADLGNEHAVPVSNATRNGNFYLESMRYMTRFFGTDGAYWDGADGPTLGHREMAKRLWTIFRQTNPRATIDVHHGHALIDSPISSLMLCLPFIDSLWNGEGFDYERFDPWAWLVEIAGLPFNVPAEMLGGDDFIGRGMLFGIWPRHGWIKETENVPKLWRIFDEFGIHQARMRGWWDQPNGVIVDRPNTYVTAYCHPRNGVLLAIATWYELLPAWMQMTFDVSLTLDRRLLGLPRGALKAVDVFTKAEVDIDRPVPLPDLKAGRLIWVRRA